MNSRWIAGLSEQEAKDIREAKKNPSVLMKRLVQILVQDLELLDSKECSEKLFDEPNWKERQAFYLGKKRMLLDYLKLIKE